MQCFARWVLTQRAEDPDLWAACMTRHHGVKPPRQMHFNTFTNKGAKLAQRLTSALRASHPGPPDLLG